MVWVAMMALDLQVTPMLRYQMMSPATAMVEVAAGKGAGDGVVALAAVVVSGVGVGGRCRGSAHDHGCAEHSPIRHPSVEVRWAVDGMGHELIVDPDLGSEGVFLKPTGPVGTPHGKVNPRGPSCSEPLVQCRELVR